MGDLDSLISRELAAINRKLFDHGVDAGTKADWCMVAGGSFVSYGLKLGRSQKIAGVQGLIEDLGVVLSGVRGSACPVRLRVLPAPALEVPHPRPYPLHWLKARGSVAALQPGEFLAGRSYDSGQASDRVMSLRRSPHVLIAGATNSGKSTLLQMMALSLAVSTSADQIEYWIIDLKNEDLIPLEGLPHVSGRHIAGDRPAAGALVRDLADLKDQRVKAGDKWTGRRVVLLVDEFAELAAVPGALDLLGSIVSTGRSKGIHVFAATQYPTAKTIGAIAKTNLNDRFVGRVADASAAAVAAGQGDTGANLLPGFGAFVAVSGPDVMRIQGFLLDRAGIDHFLAEARPAWRAAREKRAAVPALLSPPAGALTQNVLGGAAPADPPPMPPAACAVPPAVPPHVAAVFAKYWDGAELRKPGTVTALRALYGADNVPAGGRAYQAAVNDLQALLAAWAKGQAPAASPAAGAQIVNMRAYAGGRAAAGAGD